MDERHKASHATILLIEDEDITAAMLTFLLERLGYATVRLNDGREACAHIDHHDPPALVISDVMLPYRNGLHVLSHIRNHPKWSQVPVIMLTSDSSEHDIQQALDSGANDYVVKPFNPRELTARLQRFLKHVA